MAREAFKQNFDWKSVASIANAAKLAAKQQTPLKSFVSQKSEFSQTPEAQNAFSNHFVGLAIVANI